MNITDINKIVKDARDKGYDIRMSDISYWILRKYYEDNQIAYAVLFGKDFTPDTVKKYERTAKMRYLRDIVTPYLYSDKDKDDSLQGSKQKKINRKDISVEENKEALIQLLATIKRMKTEGEIDAKDAVKLETDIRIKLNDKFENTTEKSEKIVIVNSKYNDICPYCHHEVRIKTDEDLLEEIKDKYILTPKEDI